jgi:hypothetical protein
MSPSGTAPSRPSTRTSLWVGGVLTSVLMVVSGCTSNAESAAPAPTTAAIDSPRLSTGKRIGALDFTVDASNPRVRLEATEVSARTETSPEAAVRVLMTALVARDDDAAWSIISPVDRDRIAVKQHLKEQTNALGWTGFRVTGVSGDRVTLEIAQTPRISDVDGVVAASATITVPTTNDQGRYSVNWSRRTVTPHFPEFSASEDELVRNTVTAWVRDRQTCASSSPREHQSGLIGVVGLATSLCRHDGDVRVGEVSDLDSLDEPDPILEGFGGAAFQWARVVSVEAPVKMNVILAPRGTEWIVIGIERTALSQT